jgi:hypothetical protein
MCERCLDARWFAKRIPIGPGAMGRAPAPAVRLECLECRARNAMPATAWSQPEMPRGFVEDDGKRH